MCQKGNERFDHAEFNNNAKHMGSSGQNMQRCYGLIEIGFGLHESTWIRRIFDSLFSVGHGLALQLNQQALDLSFIDLGNLTNVLTTSRRYNSANNTCTQSAVSGLLMLMMLMLMLIPLVPHRALLAARDQNLLHSLLRF
jgi:hypothetical protein